MPDCVAMSYMTCPRCRLVIRLLAPYLTLDYCPRCLAKARVSVPMGLTPAAPAPPPAPEHNYSAPGQPGSPGAAETSLGELVIRMRRDQAGWVLALHGELDLASAPALAQQLDAAQADGRGRVLVDLSGLNFIDSAGLQTLLRADRRQRESGQGLWLRRGPKAVHRMFELTQTITVFRFED